MRWRAVMQVRNARRRLTMASRLITPTGRPIAAIKATARSAFS
jgi:hypothetical protein